MGCQISQINFPHKKIQRLEMKLRKEKQLYRGFCFGTKTIQVYTDGESTFSNKLISIDEQQNEQSFSYAGKSLKSIPSHNQTNPFL